VKVFGPRPSFQINLDALNGLRSQLGCLSLSSDPPYEKRYPYLDRDLLEFVYAIPREQLVRPGQRRSLMRRALVGIVPDALLQRKRKAFVARAPLTALKRSWGDFAAMQHNMQSEKMGMVHSTLLLKGVEEVFLGEEVSLSCLIRTLVLESWLKGLNRLDLSPCESNVGRSSPRRQRGRSLIEPCNSSVSLTNTS
jgi:asparagine synthase (glutamine-hydrolysing)